MSYGALGLVEVLGSCNAVVVLDQMLKTSEVEFRTWHTKCGGHATVFLSGDVAAVKAAVDAVNIKAGGRRGSETSQITMKRTFCRSVNKVQRVLLYISKFSNIVI